MTADWVVSVIPVSGRPADIHTVHYPEFLMLKAKIPIRKSSISKISIVSVPGIR